jgi:hypothetical protein
MKLTASNVIRSAGLSAMAAGVLFIVIQIIHPADVLASVSTPAWAIVHYLGVSMSFFGLFGLTGLYARQAGKAGWLGLIGYVLFSLFYACTAAFQFMEAFISPVLATAAPKVVEALLGIVTKHTNEINIGPLPTVYAATGMMYMFGALFFGIGIFRARLLPRWAALLLAFSGPLAAAITLLFGHPIDRLAAVPLGLALAGLGFALVTERREKTADPVRSFGNAQLSQTGAD